MRRPLATSIFAVLVLSGCTSVQTVDPQQRARVVDSRHVFQKNYSLGVETSAYVGEPIVRVKDYFETVQQSDALVASESFRLSIGFLGEHEDVAAGTIADVRGTTTKNGLTYRVIGIKGSRYNGEQFLLNDDGSLQGTTISRVSAKANPPTARFTATTVTKTDTSKGFTNFELVYSGVTKDSITVLYREYTPDDLARAAYSQSLVYPKDSTVIRYRDIAVTVIEASNDRLRYVVKTDGLK